MAGTTSTSTTTTSAVKTFTDEQLEGLKKEGRVIVFLNNVRVYDVTDFVKDHPGGAELILNLVGEDIGMVMRDEDTHAHSEAAYAMLEQHFIGIRDTVLFEHEFDAERAAIEAMHQKTDFASDFEEHGFLDLNKPLLMQVLRANWTRDFYLSQIHRPRHYGKGSAPIFGNFLEPISKTPWWLIPVVWIPVNLYVLSLALQGLPRSAVAVIYLFGLGLWTLVEYCMHRFLFHIDPRLPECRLAFLIHFLMHGVHHYLPMDRYRLVMPPALFMVFATPLYFLCHFVFRNYYVSQAVFAGAHMGYVYYDLMHYFIHHKRLPKFLKDTKTFHLDHHYKDYELGFGVTSNFWDRIFGTTFIPPESRT